MRPSSNERKIGRYTEENSEGRRDSTVVPHKICIGEVSDSILETTRAQQYSGQKKKKKTRKLENVNNKKEIYNTLDNRI